MAGALIGALRVSLSAETSAFEAGMKRSQRVAKQTANSIVSDFKSAGGAMGALKAGVAGFVASLSVGTIIAAGKAALDYAGSLGEVSQQLGVTTRDLQVFRYAAGQVGVDQAQLETGLSKLTITLGKVAAGAKEPAKALAAIGVSVDELKGKDTGDALRIIADGLAKIPDRAQRAAVEVALFGKSGAQLDNLLAGGSGAINELARAADELGIVLSDEQIQKADNTADKLAALKTVLAAKISAEVADNSNAILDFADALLELAKAAAAAKQYLADFERKFYAFRASEYGFDNPGQSVTVPLGRGGTADAEAKRRGYKLASEVKKPTPASSIAPFLASGGGGRKGGRDRSAEEAQRKQIDALRDANQFDQDIRRANIDILNAKRDLATDAVERYQISIDTKDAEKAAFDAQIAYETKLNELTKGEDGLSQAQAEQLRLAYEKKDQLERDLLRAEEDERARKASAEIDTEDLRLQQDQLQSQAQLAKTAKQQREIQLKILDNAYKIEKAQLEEIIASRDATEAQKEIARRRLESLSKTYSNDRQGVIDQTRNPMEEWAASIPQTSDEIIEALQSIEAEGLDHLSDALTDVIMGTKNLKEAFHEVAASVLADLLKMAIKMALLKGLSALFGGFGGGGYTGDGIGGYGTYASLVNSGAIPANGAFATGGYTGNGGIGQIAGFVHGKEFVINAHATRKYLPLLRAINDGKKIPGMATGGLAGLPISRASFASRASFSNDNSAMPAPVQNHFDLRGAVMTEDLLRQMNEMSAQAADRGASMGLQRVVDMNERTFGRWLRK